MDGIVYDWQDMVIDENSLEKLISGECDLADWVRYYGDDIESVNRSIVTGSDLDGVRTAYRFKDNKVQCSHF